MKKVVKRKKKNNRKWFVLTGIDIFLVFVIAGILLFTKNPFEFHSPDTLIALSQLEGQDGKSAYELANQNIEN